VRQAVAARQRIGLACLALAVLLAAAPVRAGEARALAVLDGWYGLVLELVRHTPTYSPPVASRALGYLGVAAWETVAAGDPSLRSLAGQLSGLAPLPEAPAHDAALALHAALAEATGTLFGNTGPIGQRTIALMEARMREGAAAGVAPELAATSEAEGRAVAAHVLAWAESDGGAVVENMGFPHDHPPGAAPGAWVPTSLIAQQQRPLLPGWGGNRPFAMPEGTTCALPPPPAYSEAEGSDFHREALEVREAGRALDAEGRAIARFWADDPMLSPTPPGHWIAIAGQVFGREEAGLATRAEVLARLGIALADAFIACWETKYRHDLLRPVTYIRRVIDPDWEPYLTTPPFPEYPSGHSTQSAAAAAVLTAAFGEGYAFEDATHVEDGLPARGFASFRAAAEEAASSRLLGGIHFRSAIERGLEQGACVGAHAVALEMRR
jgi:membrane-associated phospholipid phosphatase